MGTDYHTLRRGLREERSTCAEMPPSRGIPKSGRTWKGPGDKSFNKVAVPSLKTSWRKRQMERAEKKALKEYVNELRAAKQQEDEERKAKREERRKRREENERKAEVVQKITNTAKLKRMKKKQLKLIAKR